MDKYKNEPSSTGDQVCAEFCYAWTLTIKSDVCRTLQYGEIYPTACIGNRDYRMFFFLFSPVALFIHKSAIYKVL